MAATATFALAVAGLAAAATPATAVVATYTASGYVTHAEIPGVEVLDIDVEVWDEEGYFWEWTQTEPDGYWEIGGLDDGHYYVQAAAYGYYDELADEWVTPNLTRAMDEFDVVGGDVTGLDLYLAEGLTISGQVSLEAGADEAWLPGVRVYADSEDGNSWGYAYADAEGYYEIVGLEATDYTVQFEASSYWDDELEEDVPVNLVSEYWDDQLSWDDADLVDLGSGSVSGIDAELAVGRTISGQVTLPAGAPAAWMEAVSVSAEDVDAESYYGGWIEPDGTYMLGGLPAGEYVVQFSIDGYWDESDEYIRPNLLPEWYDDVHSWEDAEVLDLTSEDATGIDAELAIGATISGTVSLGPGVDPSELENGISVYAETYDEAGEYGWSYATADPETGDYVINGLLPVAQRVQFYAEGYYDDELDEWIASELISEYWDDQLYFEAADPVDLALGDATGIDATLDRGRTISGTVTLPAGYGAEALAGVEVYASSEDGEFGAWTTVSGDGTYTLRGLPSASYTLEFWAGGYWDEILDEYVELALVSEFYDGVYDYAEATLVDVTSADATGIDASLEAGHTISGTVTIGDGTGWDQLEGAYVYATIPGADFWSFGEIDPGTGEYTVTGLPDADYSVCLDTGYLYNEASDSYYESSLISECWDDLPYWSDGDPVTVDGTDVTGIDFEVTQAGPEGSTGVYLTDIGGSAFFTEISWFAAQGITTGYPNGDGTAEFRPFGNVTRDAMAAFLYRFAGSPEYDAPEVSPFTDVSPSKPFYKEICWLAETGITTGWDVGGGKKEFRPFAKITRDAMAAFLYRFAGEPEWEAPAVSPFVDVAVGKGFYTEITWLAETGITTGWTVKGKKEFRPFANITRDAMAAFLFRFNYL